MSLLNYVQKIMLKKSILLTRCQLIKTWQRAKITTFSSLPYFYARGNSTVNSLEKIDVSSADKNIVLI